MRHSDRTSKLTRAFLQQSADLREQLAELEWLREQIRQAEKLDPQRILAQFKAHRQQKTIKAKRQAH
ncbi:hypothetical protein CWO90_33550 [Bradyrhizobium sp. Leo121]|nr:hypothetical protein CWO90_33550 [Bradyrhizobium sp. Leo121]